MSELNDALQAYHKAIEEEFNTTLKEDDTTGLAEKARQVLTRRAPLAATTLEYLCQHADSENVRLKAAMYILDNALGKSGASDDPLEALIDKLTTPTTPQTPS